MDGLADVGGVDRDRRLQQKTRGRAIHARAMQVEIGSDPFEGARAVEHHRAEPGRVGARAHDRHVALVPVPLEERPGLGEGRRHNRILLEI